MIEILLRRAWDALDAFKQAYPENWHEEDQKVLDDLVRADLRLSGAEVKWQGMTDEERKEIIRQQKDFWGPVGWELECTKAIEAKLREKNSG